MTKIIASNRIVLKAGFTTSLVKVDQAIKALIAENAVCGIKTKLISINDVAATKNERPRPPRSDRPSVRRRAVNPVETASP